MLVLFVLVVIALLGLVAMAMDLAYLMHVRAEAQTSADAAALAGAWELIHPDRIAPVPDATQAIINARTGAVDYAAKNAVGLRDTLTLNPEPVFPDVDRNDANSLTGEVVVGHLPSWSYPPVYPWDSGNADYLWEFGNTNKYNTVCVRVQRSQTRNGPVSLYFGRLLGTPALDVHTAATAIIEWGQPIGFRPTAETGNATLIPFAVHYQDYSEALEGTYTNGGPPEDLYSYDPEGDPRVTSGSDGIVEFDLYPALGPGWTGEGEGNFGTVDLGGLDNSTAEIERQIATGVTAEDLAQWGGEFVIENDLVSGEPIPEVLEGDTGVSAGMKDELSSIIGECRSILLYQKVENPGNNATFEVIGVAGVVILEVKLTGSPKWLKVQPALCVDDSVILGGPPVGDTFPTIVRPPRLIH